MTRASRPRILASAMSAGANAERSNRKLNERVTIRNAAMSDFPDHFSAAAANYASHRPHYPPQLFAWLAAHTLHKSRAWDCGAGNGQAAIALAGHFREVIATDASTAQLAQAP